MNQRLELLQPVAGVFNLIKPGLGRLERIDQPCLVRVVFPFQSPEQRQARFNAIKLLVGKVQPVAEVTQCLRCVLQREHRTLDRFRQAHELARVVRGTLDLRQSFSRQRGCGIVPPGEQIIRLIDCLRELFKVAQQVTPLRELRLFSGLELCTFQLFNLAAETFSQQFFFIFISQERVTLLAQLLIGTVLLAIARKLRFQLAEPVQIAQVLPLVEQVLAVVLCRRDRDAADAAGRLALRRDLAADNELIVALDLVFLAPCLARVGVERRADDRLFRAGAHQFT